VPQKKDQEALVDSLMTELHANFAIVANMPPDLTDQQEEDFCNSSEAEQALELSSLDLLDTLAAMGLALAPIEEVGENVASKAYFDRLQE